MASYLIDSMVLEEVCIIDELSFSAQLGQKCESRKIHHWSNITVSYDTSVLIPPDTSRHPRTPPDASGKYVIIYLFIDQGPLGLGPVTVVGFFKKNQNDFFVE